MHSLIIKVILTSVIFWSLNLFAQYVDPSTKAMQAAQAQMEANFQKTLNAREVCKGNPKPCDQVTLENKILDLIKLNGKALSSKNDFDKDGVKVVGEKLRAEIDQLTKVNEWVCEVVSVRAAPVVIPKNSLAIPRFFPRRGFPEDECMYSENVKAVVSCQTAFNPKISHSPLMLNVANGNIHLCVTNTNVNFSTLPENSKIAFSGDLNTNPLNRNIEKFQPSRNDANYKFLYSSFDNGIDIDRSMVGRNSGEYLLNIDNAEVQLLTK